MAMILIRESHVPSPITVFLPLIRRVIWKVDSDPGAGSVLPRCKCFPLSSTLGSFTATPYEYKYL